MKIAHRIDAINKRNKGINNFFIDDIETKNNQINSIIPLDSKSSYIHDQHYASNSNDPFSSESPWRLPAILSLVWTTFLLLAVFAFIIKKTVFADLNLPLGRNRHQRIRRTDDDNEWMTASFSDDDHEADENEVPLSANISSNDLTD
ncbi:7430_t:CDS:1 [Funneliformis geosporum]|uniref:12598_t:CDS:1 n=1 Tax=Funneliformis geosporum TaxID=1117311 RepID=A0A9W4SM88_9GLOM|nr:7430_t:CDS:1 [Funneliformis geosporum]CAI2175282.1 12598_t:CDS:1 [Funneliformis geosporum]